MQYMHSYFQILKFPLIVIAFACFLCGVSNIILHPAYGLVTIIANDGVFLVGELLGIIARTILMYAPLLILLRLLTQKKNSSVTVVAGLTGYFDSTLLRCLCQHQYYHLMRIMHYSI